MEGPVVVLKLAAWKPLVGSPFESRPFVGMLVVVVGSLVVVAGSFVVVVGSLVVVGGATAAGVVATGIVVGAPTAGVSFAGRLPVGDFTSGPLGDGLVLFAPWRSGAGL